jgi:hypothetical protein
MSFGAAILAMVLGDLSTPEDTDGAADAIAEGAHVNTPVGIAVSVDSTLAATYSLVGDTSEGGFKIDPWTGVVTVADPSKIDFEGAPGHIYTITVRATKNNNFSSEQTFTISVNDIAPSTPVDSNAAANTVMEGAANGTAVGVTASSTDVNGPGVTWSLTGDTSGGGFTINAATGVITVADGSKIDYESSAGHAYTVTGQASDGTLTSSQAFTINVGDVTPTTPVDTNAAANTVAEGAAAGSTVGITASAVDPNGPATTYSLIGDTSAGGFTINASTGVVTVANSSKIDFESSGAGHSYNITVQASNGALSTSQPFTIGVTDVAPSTPTDGNAAANTVVEGAANGTVVGLTVASTDVNGPAVTYSLTGDTSGGGFAVNATTGVITVADSTKINYETPAGHAYTVTVQASDGTLTSSKSFSIAVTDVAPSTPVDANGAANSVAEGAANGTAVGVTASSTDINGPAVTYSLTGDTSGGGFTINSATGVITVADATKIDYETAAGHAYTVTAQASDGTLASSQTFTIAVTNVAPSAPTDSNAATNTIAEGAANGTAVGITAASTDPGGGPAPTYSLTDNAGGRFAINSTTGVVTVANGAAIDFETAVGNAYSITVQGTSGALSTTQSFSIGVTDVGPSTPTDNNGAGNSVFEGAANGTAVGITASSADPGGGPAPTYSLTDSAGGRFAIDDNTGIVTVANGAAIDFETAPGAGHSYGITVQSTAGALSSTQGFSIGVGNVNEAPAGTDKAVLIAEDTIYTFSVADFGFSDPSDSIAPNSLLAVKMTTVPGSGEGTLKNNGNPVNAGDSVSAADIAAGFLVFTPVLDGNGSPEATFTFQVQDNGGTANSGVDLDQSANTFTINVNAGNDAPINSVPGTHSVNEDATLTFSSGTGNAITISDVDIGSGDETVTLTVTSGALTLGSTAGLTTFTNNAASITLTGTVANVNAALNGLTYTGNLDFNGTDTLIVDTNDNGNTGTPGPRNDSDNVTINVAAVNDAPVITPTGGSTAYIENAAAVTVDGSLTVTDPDSSIVSAQVRVSANFQTGDLLNFVDQNGITGVYTPGTGVLALSGTASVADYQAALRSITFSSTNNDPGVSKTIEFKVNDSLVDSNLATKTLAVTPVNGEPTLTATANGGGAVTFTETSIPDFPGSGAVDLFNTPSTSTVEAGQTVTQVVLTVTNVADTTEFLTIGATAVDLVNGNSEGVTVGGAAGTASVSITGGTATITVTPTTTFSTTNVNALVDSLAYNNDDDTPAATTHTISVTSLTDSGANGGANNDDNTGSPSVSAVVTVMPTNDAPTAADFTFNGASSAIGNTSLVLDDGSGPAAPDPAGPQKTISGSLLAGATDPDGPNALTTVAVTNQATAHGHVTISTGGEFSYAPTAGYVGIDSFNYTVTDGNTPAAGTDTGSVTITISTPRVWYVNADAASDGDGTSDNPFNTLAHFNDAGDNVDGTDDTIFLYNATNHYTGGLTLENNEKLIGQNQGLTVNGTALEPAAGPNNAIIDGGLVLGSGDTLSGVTLGNTGAGTALSGTNFGTLRIDHVVVNTDNNGIILNTGAFGADASFTSVSAAGATGVSLTGVTGNVDFGTGSMSGQFAVSGGTVNTAYDGNLSQARNASMVDVSGGHDGELMFDTGTLSATNGTGLQFDNADGHYQFLKPFTLNGGDAGIDIVNGSNGSFSFWSSFSSITNPSGVAFNVNGAGQGTIAYPGDITKNTDGQTISIQNVAPGGLVYFNGVVSSTGFSDGINLANNTGATITFYYAVLQIDTSASNTTGFSATGGGTVNVNQIINRFDFVNTINSGQGTALKVADTTIGTDGLTFRSISSNGAVNGIVLNNTGTSGGLTVTGDGGGSSNSSGGQILGSTGAGVSLNSTSKVSLGYMNINNGLDDGIHGESVSGFTLNRSNVNNNGNSTSDDGIQFGLESGATVGLTGAVSITNSSVSGNAHNNVHIRDTSGTISSLTVTGSSFNNLNDTFGANSFLFEGSGTSVLTSATFSGNTVQNNSPQRGLEVQAHDTATVGTFTVSGNTFIDNGIQASFTQDGSSNLAFKFLNNGTAGTPMTGSILQAVNVLSSSQATGGTIVGTISGNFIGNAAVTNSGSTQRGGISATIEGQTDATLLISGNNIQQTFGDSRGIYVGVRGPANPLAGTLGPNTIVSDVTITNNTVMPGNTANNLGAAIVVEADNQTGNDNRAPTVRADIRGNTVPDVATRPVNGEFFNAHIIYREYSSPGSTGIGQLVDTAPASATATAQLTSTNTGTSQASAGITLIAGPIGTPPLNAAPGGVQALTPTPGETQLTQAQLDSVVAAAVAQWAAAGASVAQLAMLAALTFTVEDLAGTRVGEQTPGHILIDPNAAGHGWFVDSTPNDSSEFSHAANAAGTDLYTDATNAAAGHLDLLTAVLHEMGHALGLDDSAAASDAHDLMYIDLVDGERRVPDAADVAQAHGISGAQAAEADLPLSAQAAAGTPIVAGTAGNDTIDAGHGGNILFGGAGADNFVFGPSIQFNAPTPAQVTHVADYSAAQGDTFDFSALTSAFHNSSVSDSLVVRALEDASGKFATLQVDHIDPMGLPSAPNWVSVAQLDGAHAGDAVNIWIGNHSVHLAQIHVDLLV